MRQIYRGKSDNAENCPASPLCSLRPESQQHVTAHLALAKRGAKVYNSVGACVFAAEAEGMPGGGAAIVSGDNRRQRTDEAAVLSLLGQSVALEAADGRGGGVS